MSGSSNNTIVKVNESVTISVYQCSECLKVVSDSTFSVEIEDDFPALVLTDITDSVHQEDGTRVSKRMFDKRSTYQKLICDCGQELGSYELGKGQKRFLDQNSSSLMSDNSVKTAIEKLQHTVVFLHNRLKAIEDCLGIDT